MINADKKKEMKNLSEMLLETRGLTKRYGHHKAVDSVSMHIKKGAIYGFIGRNGAGKTTCLKMISGLSRPTSGEIEIFGYKGKDLQKVRSRVGCLIEAPGLYGNMTAYENLNIKCKLFGIKKAGYIDEILKTVGLEHVGRKKTKHFSLGMKQRLGALYFINNIDDKDLVAHSAGAEAFRRIANYCRSLGVEYLTVYAFSTENWKRSQEEVGGIMLLLRKYLEEALLDMEKNRVRFRFFGDLSRLSPQLQKLCHDAENRSVAYDVQVNFCLNYGGRDEIVRAAQAFAQEVAAGKRRPEELTEGLFENYLYSAGVPDPELIIRPSGEMRTTVLPLLRGHGTRNGCS